MKKLLLLAFLAMSLQADMFDEGSKSIGLKIGSASIGSEQYFIAGLNGNYFVLDDLSVGIGYEQWFSGDPDISKVTLESTYFLEASETIRPYAGLIYRRILVNGSDRFGNSYDDTNSYGGRAGVAFSRKHMLLSAGLVYEKYDTTEQLFNDSETYLEFTIGFFF